MYCGRTTWTKDVEQAEMGVIFGQAYDLSKRYAFLIMIVQFRVSNDEIEVAKLNMTSWGSASKAAKPVNKAPFALASFHHNLATILTTHFVSIRF
jgi:hypothetical protein